MAQRLVTRDTAQIGAAQSEGMRGGTGGQRLRARTGDGAAVLALLTSDGGRAFMLLDAAIGDLG